MKTDRFSKAGDGVVVIGLGGLISFALAAIWALGHLTPWPAVLAACLTVVAVIKTFTIVRRMHPLAEAAASLRSRVDLLEAELSEQQESVDQLADGIHAAILVCDAERHIIYANRKTRELFRFDNPRGRSLLAVSLSHDLDELVRRALESGERQSAEVLIKDPVEHILHAVAWKAPERRRTFLSLYDITELRRLERVRQDFVDNVSHELRTPLTIIRSLAETLQDEVSGSDEKAVASLERIMAEVDRLSALTGDLLTLSAAESGTAERSECDVAQVWRQAIKRRMEVAAARGLSLTCAGPEHLVIEANEAQMMQTAINLIENGLNYTQEGGVTITIKPGDDSVTIETVDTGIGISSEFQERIFERFYRVDKGRSRATGGTGLGLSIVKNIIEAHGGTVSVQSSLHQGSVFTVTLPTKGRRAQPK